MGSGKILRVSILSADRFRPYRWGVLLVLLGLFAAHDVVIGVGQLVAPHAGMVDFRVYFAAAQALEHGRPLYASPPPCCFNAGAMRGYTYPPLFAFLLIPLTGLPIDDAGRVWLGINYASLIALLVVGARAARPRFSLETIGWLLLMMLASAPIGAAMYGIQVDPLIVLLEAVFAWSIVTDRRLALGGAALALAACIKVSPLLIAPAILLLPPRRALQAFACLAAGLAAGTLTMFLISPQAVAYVTHVLPSFSGGVVSPWNRSLPGVILRLLGSQGWHPGSGLGTVFLLVEIAALAATWFVCSRVPGASGRVLMVAGLLAVVPIFQGVTWDHHLTVEILVLLLLVPMLQAGSLAWILAVGGVLLTGVNQQIIDASLRSHGLEPPHGIGQIALFGAGASIDLIGMLAALAAVLLLARLQAGAAYNPAATSSARRSTLLRKATPLTSADLAPT
jgi:alpha-1,2-mannosyltransferase